MLEKLAEHLRTHREAIVDRWIALANEEDSLLVVHHLTRSEFRNHMPPALDALEARLRQESLHSLGGTQVEVALHGQHRWKRGFSLHQLVRDWGHLQQAVLECMWDHFAAHPGGQEPQRRAQHVVARFINDALGYSVARYDELRRTEAESLRLDLDAMRGRFEALHELRAKLLHEFTHDVRGRLSTVTQVSDLMAMDCDPEDSDAHRLLSVMQRNLDGISDMLDQLQDLTRIEAGRETAELQEVDLVPLCAEILASLQPQTDGDSLVLRYEGPDNLRVRTDGSKVRRIVQNLLLNALRYTKEGHVTLKLDSGPDRWCLAVEDTGPGMQDDQGTPLAGELSASSPNPSGPRRPGYQGEGVGLAIVKRLSELLQAHIDLQSETGQGTTFHLEFPLDPTP